MKVKLTENQIKEITTGAAKIVYKAGRYHFFRFNDCEADVINHPFVLATAGIQMHFKTDGRLLKLKVYTEKAIDTRSYFSFDVFVNSSLAGCIQNLCDDSCARNYADSSYTTGSFYNEFVLGDGEKDIKIVFPHSVIACIECIEITDATYIVPIKKEKTIVFYGDSITQGFDALHPSRTYAATLAEALDAEIINKAVGGAVFNPALAKIPCDTKPDYIIVAYGTNDWNSVDLESLKKNAEGFLDGINSNYPGIPVFVTTPLWRPDWKATKKCGEFSNVDNTIKEIFGHQENITVISGIDLIPHDENLFGDLYLHPSDKGFEHYTDSLKKYFTI